MVFYFTFILMITLLAKVRICITPQYFRNSFQKLAANSQEIPLALCYQIYDNFNVNGVFVYCYSQKQLLNWLVIEHRFSKSQLADISGESIDIPTLSWADLYKSKPSFMVRFRIKLEEFLKAKLRLTG